MKILGRDDYRIDPNTDDLFKRLIDLRDEAKTKGNPIQKALKIVGQLHGLRHFCGDQPRRCP